MKSALPIVDNRNHGLLPAVADSVVQATLTAILPRVPGLVGKGSLGRKDGRIPSTLS